MKNGGAQADGPFANDHVPGCRWAWSRLAVGKTVIKYRSQSKSALVLYGAGALKCWRISIAVMTDSPGASHAARLLARVRFHAPRVADDDATVLEAQDRGQRRVGTDVVRPQRPDLVQHVLHGVVELCVVVGHRHRRVPLAVWLPIDLHSQFGGTKVSSGPKKYYRTANSYTRVDIYWAQKRFWAPDCEDSR